LTAHESRLRTGPFAGETLGRAWHAMPESWRGTDSRHFLDFPLLVKFLFPNDKLSIQVHPDDEYASKFELQTGGRGKTEMWHIVSARPGAELLLGLKPGVTRQEFSEAVRRSTVEDLLVHCPVQAGETYFVAAGTQHALCGGMIVCEIQEYSDLTYRVHDYGRVDSSGRLRELHLEKALAVTRYEGTPSGRIPPLALHSPDANKHLLAACEFFSTERWGCDRTTFVEGDPQGFQLLVILEGSGTLYDSELALGYQPGQAWFLPASLPLVVLQPREATSLLRVTIPDRDRLHHQLLNQGFDAEAISRVLPR